jgi:hypothetical protein
MWILLKQITSSLVAVALAVSLVKPIHGMFVVYDSRTVRFEVFTVVTMKNGVFWDVMPCGSCKNRRFGGT